MIKNLAAIVILLFSGGCTTLKPVELPPEDLQGKILAGEIIEKGDTVKVVTREGKQYRFRVTVITDHFIAGEDVKVSIDDIIAVETREFSGGKTSLLMGGTLLWMYIILLSIPVVVAI